VIVAGVQMDVAWEDPDENFRRAGAAIERASADGACLVALPEMFATGFSMSTELVSAQAERTRAFLADAARSFDVWLLGGLAEPSEGLPHNVALLVGPDGKTALRYEKLHPFTLSGEHERYAAGRTLATADVDGVLVTPLVCYDLRFPEPFRIAAAGTHLFVVIANWPRPRRSAWQTLLRARAMENQAYVLGVNRVGEGDGLVYLGDSALIDPMGEAINAASHQPAVVSGDVAPSLVADLRAKYSFLADRRPQVYAALGRQEAE